MRPHEAIPDGNGLWRLTTVGQVFLGETADKEAHVSCEYREVELRSKGSGRLLSNINGSSYKSDVGVGYWSNLKVGSVWRYKRVAHAAPDLVSIELVADPISAEICTVDKEKGYWRRPVNWTTVTDASDLPAEGYVKTIAECRGSEIVLFVPVSEIIRRFYAVTTLLAREIFNFDANGNNARLFDHLRTDYSLVHNGTFSISPTPDVEIADVIYLATLLASRMGKIGLATIGASVKGAALRNVPAFPKAVLPFDRPETLSAKGMWVSLEGRTRGFIALQIERCSMAPSFKDLKVERTTSIDADVDAHERPVRLSSHRKLSPSIRVQSRKPVNWDFAREEEKQEDLTLIFPNLEGIKVIYEKGVESPQPGMLVAVDCPQIPDSLSTEEESTGSGGVAGLDEHVCIPHNVEVDEEVMPAEEVVGSDELFGADGLTIPNAVLHTSPYIPYPLENLCLAGDRLRLHFKVGMVGFEDRCDLTSGYPLLELPLDWGKWSSRGSASDGTSLPRRAAVLEVRFGTGYVYIFDAERKKRTEPIAMVVLSHNLGARLEDVDIACILNYAVAHDGVWPQRSGFGDIRTRILKHTKNHLFSEGLAEAILLAHDEL